MSIIIFRINGDWLPKQWVWEVQTFRGSKAMLPQDVYWILTPWKKNLAHL